MAIKRKSAVKKKPAATKKVAAKRKVSLRRDSPSRQRTLDAAIAPAPSASSIIRRPQAKPASKRKSAATKKPAAKSPSLGQRLRKFVKKQLG